MLYFFNDTLIAVLLATALLYLKRLIASLAKMSYLSFFFHSLTPQLFYLAFV